MAILNLANNTCGEPDGFVQVATGEDIDFDSSQEDAVIEISAFDNEGNFAPMCPYGYTLNKEEAEKVFQLLGKTLGHFE